MIIKELIIELENELPFEINFIERQIIENKINELLDYIASEIGRNAKQLNAMCKEDKNMLIFKGYCVARDELEKIIGGVKCGN